MFSIAKKYYDLGFLGGAGMLSFLPLPGIGSGGGSGPPFAADSADNGLSVDPITGHIVLGNDLTDTAALLLSDREIAMGGKSIQLTDPDLLLFINSNSIQLTDNSGGNNFIGLFVSATDAHMELIGTVGGGSAPAIKISEVGFSHSEIRVIGSAFEVAGTSGTRLMLSADSANQIYQLGDLSVAANGTLISVEPSNQRVVVGLASGNRVADFGTTNFNVQLGDIDSVGNDTILNVFDNLQRINANVGGINNVLFLDGTSKNYSLGDPGSDFLLIDGLGFQTKIVTNGTTTLFLDLISGQYSIGDFDGSGNGTLLTLDDGTSIARIAATNGLNLAGSAYSINGTPGDSGSFTAQSGETVTVTGGIITAITP
jgi:hypothetical protein